MWPDYASDGWEPIGTPIVTDPRSHPLPVVRRSAYFDPAPLGGIGTATGQLVHLLGETTIASRTRSGSVEVEFLQPEVYGVGLLDYVVVPEILEECALVLDVFDDDRETIKWAVGSTLSSVYPYLVEPDHYAEQEVDVAQGGATLGTVSVVVIDPAQTPGDQDSGWLTERLAEAGLPDIAGRRCRLRRFIDDEGGYQVIADGPAGAPRLDGSFAAYTWEIRDTRETERKLKLFGGEGAGGATNGARTLLPDGVLGGYGLAGAAYLIDPAEPVTGTFWKYLPETVLLPAGAVSGYVSVTGNPTAQRLMSFSAHEATRGEVTYQEDPPAGHYSLGDPARYTTFRDLIVLWRAEGSTDPYAEIGATLIVDRGGGGDGLLVSAVSYPNDTSPTARIALTIYLGDTRGAAFLPGDGEAIELLLVYRGVPTEELPVYVEGVTVGEFLQNAYDGVYSARDEAGDLVPSGIRYDPDALVVLTTPIRLRLTDPIDDARTWLEQHIYAPIGYAPALDQLGQVSPVSQVAPVDVTGLPVIDNDAAEASSDWSAGERIINVLQFRYYRDYVPPIEEGLLDVEYVRTNTGRARRQLVAKVAEPTEPDGDGVVSREILVEFVDEVSVARHGRQVLTIEADAFHAIGTTDGDPIDGEWDNEVGWQLAQLRQEHVHNRYSLGAPAVSLAVRRAVIPTLRAGDWVILDLSWLPDYVTRRRGLLALGQVVALGDLDCAWRQLLVEQVVPLLEPSS